MAKVISSKGCLVDIAYVLEYNTWNDVTRIQVQLRDIKLTVGNLAPTL
jgi:hypothetical protein